LTGAEKEVKQAEKEADMAVPQVPEACEGAERERKQREQGQVGTCLAADVEAEECLNVDDSNVVADTGKVVDLFRSRLSERWWAIAERFRDALAGA
jgi:hypothetical protein